MIEDSPAGLIILKAVRASLRLVNSSTELFTMSQMLALKFDIDTTLAVVNGQIQAEKPSASG